jgi:hypothetical protein
MDDTSDTPTRADEVFVAARARSSSTRAASVPDFLAGSPSRRSVTRTRADAATRASSSAVIPRLEPLPPSLHRRGRERASRACRGLEAVSSPTAARSQRGRAQDCAQAQRVSGTRERTASWRSKALPRPHDRRALADAHAKYREPFEPLLPGVTWVAPATTSRRSSAAAASSRPRSSEPIQGEAGVRELARVPARGARLCDETGRCSCTTKCRPAAAARARSCRRRGRREARHRHAGQADRAGLPMGCASCRRALRHAAARRPRLDLRGGPLVCRARWCSCELEERPCSSKCARAAPQLRAGLEALQREFR